jgi:hypothetical protein
MMMFIKSLNIILISALTLFVGFVSAMFFIGSNETYSRLLKTLPSSFARRALGGICVGVIGAVLILLINYLFIKINPSTKSMSLKKLFGGTVTITAVASIIGTAIFFSIRKLLTKNSTK